MSKPGMPENDDLLADLLDSALSDFKAADSPTPQHDQQRVALSSTGKSASARVSKAAEQPATVKKQAAASSAQPTRAASASPAGDDLADMERMFGGLMGMGGNSQNMEDQLNTMMQFLKQEDPELFGKFHTLNERASNLDDEASEVDFANLLQDTLSYLNDGMKDERAENSAGTSASAKQEDSEIPASNLEQFVDSASEMMRSLLSRTVFYPLIKSLTSKYPDWLDCNRLRLTATEFQKHEQQYAALRRIREVYERNDEQSQSELLSTADFDSVIALLREAQSFGDPPAELLDQTDASAFSSLGKQACVVM